MGGDTKFPYPKWVWSPVGGWWCSPPNWRRNTAITAAGLVLTVGYVWSWSAALEVRARARGVAGRTAGRSHCAARPIAAHAPRASATRARARSAQRRPNTPIRPIFSETWAKHALVDRAAGGTPKVY